MMIIIGRYIGLSRIKISCLTLIDFLIDQDLLKQLIHGINVTDIRDATNLSMTYFPYTSNIFV